MWYKTKQFVALSLIFCIAGGTVRAGITFTVSNGITATGADGVRLVGTNGITATGADGISTFPVNGITATGADGITATGADGITATGADGVMHTGTNGITATGADGITATGADGITATGADGVTVRDASGTVYRVLSARVTQPNGITATGADGITATGADGITATGADGVNITWCNGITATGVDGLTINSANGITATGADGTTFHINGTGAVISDIENLTGIGVSSFAIRSTATLKSLSPIAAPATNGIQSLDPELAWQLNQTVDDSGLNAVIVFHHQPTANDLAQLQALGIVGGTRYNVLPFVTLTATKNQLIAISRWPIVRSIYGQRTLQFNANAQFNVTGINRAAADTDLRARNNQTPYTGRNVTVAVLDTGVDATHSDLAGRVAQNVRLQDTQGVGVGFNLPVFLENQANTDPINGHGTFVAGVATGTGTRSNGRYRGIAPNANIVGLSAGDYNLLFVLAGMDYLLARGRNYNVRVVNCSFSANTVFDLNDPVNVATKMLTDSGINVVFSAGNTGPGLGTLNPYAAAPWVVSVGATDEQGKLASFSSRGTFASHLFRPTLVAPGVNIASVRSSTLVGTTTAFGTTAVADAQPLTPAELPYYTKASGTSFSAPAVAGIIANMVEANPNLTPAKISEILQRTATPLPGYYVHEVGAGMVNAHAAILSAAFSNRRMGLFRAGLDVGQVSYQRTLTPFEGVLQPFGASETAFTLPAQTVMASAQVAWGGLTTPNDLALSLKSPQDVTINAGDEINLPGLTGRVEHETVLAPSAGVWRARVYQQVAGANITAQPFRGVLETVQARYAPLSDFSSTTLDAATKDAMRQSLRSFTVIPAGNRFGATWAVTRGELAAALVLGGRIPQYLGASPWFADVTDNTTRNFVESVQAHADGPLFYDAPRGTNFRPNAPVTRLALAVALVRAAGLETQARSTLLNTSDVSLLPTAWQGFASLALSRGWLARQGLNFNPNGTVTRAELARIMAQFAQ